MRWTGTSTVVAVCLVLGSALRGDEIEWRSAPGTDIPKTQQDPQKTPQPDKPRQVKTAADQPDFSPAARRTGDTNTFETVKRVNPTPVPVRETNKGKIDWYTPTTNANEWTAPSIRSVSSQFDVRFQPDDQKPVDSAPFPRPSPADPMSREPRELPIQQTPINPPAPTPPPETRPTPSTQLPPAQPLPQPQPTQPTPSNPPPLPSTPPQAMPQSPTTLPPLAQPSPPTQTPTQAPAAQPWYTQPSYHGPQNPGPNPCESGACANGTCSPNLRMGCQFGSANLTVSRDYHFLDLFGLSVFSGEQETTIIPEQRSVTDRFFVDGEFLLWWQKQQNIPVLASTNSTGLPFLGTPGTQSLLGPGPFGSSEHVGFRVRAGAWFGCCEEQGVDGSLFVLGKKTDSVVFNSSQFPTIGRPIFAANLNSEFAELTAQPGLATGNLRVDTSSSLWGADLNYRRVICRSCDTESIFFAGYRFLNLSEDLTITENLVAGPTSPDPVGTNIFVQDSFSVKNYFNGGQIGWAVNRQAGRWTLNARASVAIGDTHQELDVNGSQIVAKPGAAPQNFSGGLLAVGPNLGSFTKDKFSVVPEATINVGYQFTDHLRGFVGYNFLYWTNVVRPGDQIDRVIDLSNVPNFGTITPVSNHPVPTFTQSNYWTQGVQFGIEWKW